MRISYWSSDVGSSDLLAPWFHNMPLGGVQTAPDHFLADYPANKFERFKHVLPDDLSGTTVLDIGCNAGFHAIEMKRRGALRVVGIDSDERYLAQARLAAEVHGMDITFQQLSVYDVAAIAEPFDIVIFMGVLRSEEHTSELQSLMRLSYAVLCLTT